MTGARPVPGLPAGAVVTVGVFDGVHVAHQQLVRTAIRLARRYGTTCGVITFHPDPQQVLDPAHAQPSLMPIEARLARLALLGVDWIWVVPFTKPFARTPASRFVRETLIGRLHAGAVVVGDRFLFGHDREGDLQMLRRLGAPSGMRAVPVAPIQRGGEPISSSRIRRLLARGLLSQAARLLGAPPALYGVVVPGAGRGHQLGFPTANLRLTSQVVPPHGVYAVRLVDAADGRARPGVMNLGVRPTFGVGPVVCEVHLLGFRGRLVRHRVAVSLLRRLRGERCFATPRALRAQIRRDIARARRLFSR